MKSKFIILILLVLTFALASLTIVLFQNSKEISEQLLSRDKLIKKYQDSDSLNCKHNEEYVKTVTKYVTPECGLLVGDVEITLDKFIKIYKDELDKKDKLETELENKKDSLHLLKTQIELLNKQYHLNVITQVDGNTRTIWAESKKIDSALILLRHFRDRLSYDSATKKWSIRMK
jgi:hypothetical protein